MILYSPVLSSTSQKAAVLPLEHMLVAERAISPSSGHRLPLAVIKGVMSFHCRITLMACVHTAMALKRRVVMWL